MKNPDCHKYNQIGAWFYLFWCIHFLYPHF